MDEKFGLSYWDLFNLKINICILPCMVRLDSINEESAIMLLKPYCKLGVAWIDARDNFTSEWWYLYLWHLFIHYSGIEHLCDVELHIIGFFYESEIGNSMTSLLSLEKTSQQEYVFLRKYGQYSSGLKSSGEYTFNVIISFWSITK